MKSTFCTSSFVFCTMIFVELTTGSNCIDAGTASMWNLLKTNACYCAFLKASAKSILEVPYWNYSCALNGVYKIKFVECSPNEVAYTTRSSFDKKSGKDIRTRYSFQDRTTHINKVQ